MIVYGITHRVIARAQKWGPRKTVVLWGEEKSRHGWNFLLAENGTLCLVLRRCGNLKELLADILIPKGQDKIQVKSRDSHALLCKAGNDTQKGKII